MSRIGTLYHYKCRYVWQLWPVAKHWQTILPNDCVEFCLCLLLGFRVEYHIQNCALHSSTCRISTSCRVNRIISASHLTSNDGQHTSIECAGSILNCLFSLLVRWIGFIQLCNEIADIAPSSGPFCLYKLSTTPQSRGHIFTIRFSTSANGSSRNCLQVALVSFATCLKWAPGIQSGAYLTIKDVVRCGYDAFLS